MWQAESDFLFTATGHDASVPGQLLFCLVILFPLTLLRDIEMPSMWLSENQSEFPFERFWRLATVSHVLVAQCSRDYVGDLTDVCV